MAREGSDKNVERKKKNSKKTIKVLTEWNKKPTQNFHWPFAKSGKPVGGRELNGNSNSVVVWVGKANWTKWEKKKTRRTEE